MISRVMVCLMGGRDEECLYTVIYIYYYYIIERSFQPLLAACMRAGVICCGDDELPMRHILSPTLNAAVYVPHDTAPLQTSSCRTFIVA